MAKGQFKPTIVMLGTGGVGKTTSSLIAAYTLADAGARVQLLTVDPSRRLDDLARKVGQGHPNLELTRIDVKELFEQFVRRHAPDEATAEAVVGSRFFPYLTDHLPALHEYVAADLIMESVDSGRYDHVVVDTPPFAYAIHFLEAPRRLNEMASMAAKVFSAGGTARGLGASAIPGVIWKGLAYFLGKGFLLELVDFIGSFGRLWEQIERRFQTADELFRTATTFGAVIVPDSRSTADLLHFLELAPPWLHVDFLMVNRMVSYRDTDDGATIDPVRLADEVSAEPTCREWKPHTVESAVQSVMDSWDIASAVRQNQMHVLATLERDHPGLLERSFHLPLVPGGVRRQRELEKVGERLRTQLLSSGLLP